MDDRGAGRNVVFVVMDTVRKDHLTPYGYDRETTPALESFASEAAVYEQAVAPAPWTLPVHASMFTGRYPGEHGATQETPYLEGSRTLAQSLSASHRSACFSSNAWITPYTRLTDGFDVQDNFFQALPGDVLSGPLASLWKRANDSPRLRTLADRLVSLGNRLHERFADSAGAGSKTPAVIDRTIEFVDGTDEPYFAFLNLMDAHLPYHPPAEQKERFAPGVDSTAVCQNSKRYNSGAREIDAEEWATIRDLYDAEIAHIDTEIGRLFSWLRENDEWEDSLVVVCADHGELHGEHDLFGHEFAVYDPIVNVPLMVKHPDLDGGRHDEQVELLDLYHTVLDHAGVDPGSDGLGSEGPESDGHEGAPVGSEDPKRREPTGGVSLDRGRSLLSKDHTRVGGDSTPAFIEYGRPVVELRQLENKARAGGVSLSEDSRYYSRMRAARTPDAKYVHNERIADEAYRLDTDPGETEDLLGEDDPVLAALSEDLAAFESRVGGWGPTGDGDVLDGMDENAKRRLEELGYID